MQQTEDPQGKGVGGGEREQINQRTGLAQAPQSCSSLSHEFTHTCSPQDSARRPTGRLADFEAHPLPRSSSLEICPRAIHQANLGSSISFLHSVRPPGWAWGRVCLIPCPVDSGSARAPSCISCFSGLSPSLSVSQTYSCCFTQSVWFSGLL